MRGLQRLSSRKEINQFIKLWTNDTGNAADRLNWRHHMVFLWQRPLLIKIGIWNPVCRLICGSWLRTIAEVQGEPKCKFFSWLLLQNKLWIAGRIIKNSGQANPVCQLCHTTNETHHSTWSLPALSLEACCHHWLHGSECHQRGAIENSSVGGKRWSGRWEWMMPPHRVGKSSTPSGTYGKNAVDRFLTTKRPQVCNWNDKS